MPGADTTDMANYRGITNLNTTGKLLEHIVQKQLRRHIKALPNVGPLQSACRALHSTKTAMTRVVIDLLTAADSRTLSVLQSLDISAAFDTLDQRRILDRAKDLFGFEGVTLKWLSSYLSGCQHDVSVGGQRSPTVTMSSGIPQGSALGPLIFSVFTTPVGALILSFGISYYQSADDTQLYPVISSTAGCMKNLSTCADAVMTWYIMNNLLLNSNKTEALVAEIRQPATRQVRHIKRSCGFGHDLNIHSKDTSSR